MQYHNTLDALTFDQTAAEDYALYVQGFQLARFRLDEELKARMAAGQDPSKFYVISDLDETLLDNTQYNVWQVATGHDFHDDTWKLWCAARSATATPGAVEFANYAAGLNVKLIYVSSRFDTNRADTAANLTALGFPLPDSSGDPGKTSLFLAGMSLVAGGPPTKKNEQFAYLTAQRFGIAPILQLGDNLSDHEADRYSSKTRYDVRGTNAVADKDRWGKDWIVFPNPVYGAWRQTLKVVSGGVEFPATDDPVPVPFQATVTRPVVTPAEAPKLALLAYWKPNPPLP